VLGMKAVERGVDRLPIGEVTAAANENSGHFTSPGFRSSPTISRKSFAKPTTPKTYNWSIQSGDNLVRRSRRINSCFWARPPAGGRAAALAAWVQGLPAQ
jgi:hypothetical protein